MTSMRIDGRLIGPGQRTLVIAEIGVNHDGRLDRALELVHHASAAGADAVKLQIFNAASLMHPSSDFAQYQKQSVSASDPAAMLREYELSEPDLRLVVNTIRELRMMPLATPFSPSDVDMIEALHLPAVKIASPDLVNRVLLSRVAASKKPMIISTGAATIEEVGQAVQWLDERHSTFALMHCVSSYPTPSCDAHIAWIRELAKFDRPVGYSDHATEPLAGALAVAAGACIVEKHLTYDRSARGPDHAASADPVEFAEYIRLIRTAEVLSGSETKHVLPIESDVRTVSRQSLVLARDVGPGEVIRQSDLTVQRPGTGISAADADAAAGKAARIAMRKGTMLQWDMLTDAA